MEIITPELTRLDAKARKRILIERFLRFAYSKRTQGFDTFAIMKSEQDINKLPTNPIVLRNIIRDRHDTEESEYLNDYYIERPERSYITFIGRVSIPAEIVALLLLEGFTRNEIFNAFLFTKPFSCLPVHLYDKVVESGYPELAKKINKSSVLKPAFWKADSQVSRDEFAARKFVRKFILFRESIQALKLQRVEDFVRQHFLTNGESMQTFPETYCLNMRVANSSHIINALSSLPEIINDPFEHKEHVLQSQVYAPAFKKVFKAMLRGDKIRLAQSFNSKTRSLPY